MGTGFANVLMLFVVGFVVGYLATRHRKQVTRVQAGMLLGFVLFITPLTVTQIAQLL